MSFDSFIVRTCISISNFFFRLGYGNVVVLLIKNGANIDPEEFYSRTPLQWAAKSGKTH